MFDHSFVPSVVEYADSSRALAANTRPPAVASVPPYAVSATCFQRACCFTGSHAMSWPALRLRPVGESETVGGARAGPGAAGLFAGPKAPSSARFHLPRMNFQSASF